MQKKISKPSRRASVMGIGIIAAGYPTDCQHTIYGDWSVMWWSMWRSKCSWPWFDLGMNWRDNMTLGNLVICSRMIMTLANQGHSPGGHMEPAWPWGWANTPKMSWRRSFMYEVTIYRSYLHESPQRLIHLAICVRAVEDILNCIGQVWGHLWDLGSLFDPCDLCWPLRSTVKMAGQI